MDNKKGKYMSEHLLKIKMPEKCLGCNWRDAEYGGSCMLMPNNPFHTYSTQYYNCPIKRLIEEYEINNIQKNDNNNSFIDWEYGFELK